MHATALLTGDEVAAAVARPHTIFLLGNGRSGTRYLCDLFRANAADCTALHEPYLRRAAPSMFGRPIYDCTHGDREAIRRAFDRKRRGILSYQTAWYVETNHAFLKSFADVAMESFPDMKLVHVVRNPLASCASQANREEFIERWRIPLRHYYIGGKRYYRWRLTGEEPIYRHFEPGELTLFQTFVVQWIEIENRAQRFLDRYEKRGDCFLLHTPGDLNDPAKLRAMFRYFSVPLRHNEVVLHGVHNRTPGRRHAVTNDHTEQLRRVVERLPAKYLAIFEEPPYAQFEWSRLLAK